MKHVLRSITLYLLYPTFTLEASSFQFLENIDPLFTSIAPNMPTTEVAFTGNKLYAKIATELPILKFSSNEYTFSFSIPSFFNIHNFSQNQLSPWQLWRGFVGLKSSAKWKDFFISAGIYHESSHATGIFEFVSEFTTLSNTNEFPNKTLLSHEHLMADFTTYFEILSFKLFMRPQLKYFLPNLSKHSQTYFDSSLSLELQFQKQLESYIFWLGLNFEMMFHHLEDIQSLYIDQFHDTYLYYLSMEIGFERIIENRHLQIFCAYKDYHGYGLTLSKLYQEFALGLRLKL